MKCLTGQQWNGTKPTCLTDKTPVTKTTLDRSNEEKIKVETIIIIVWVLGGILLFAMLILLTVIVTARRKVGLRRQAERRTSVFTVAAESRRGGGDNPAFTRENEGVNWSLHRNSERLPPSYREAMLDRPPRLEIPRGQQVTNQRTATTSGASQDDNSRRYAQEYPSCFWEEEPPPPYSLFADDRHIHASDRAVNIDRTRSTRLTTNSTNRATVTGDTSTGLLTSTAQIHQQPSSVSQPQLAIPQPQQQHPARTPTSAQADSSRRHITVYRRERPSASPQIVRSNSSNTNSSNNNTSRVNTQQYRCGRIEASAPLARLEIEYF
ncbi:uncharacterized protein LOC126816126 [Patella vulgata]|uniref:uncharacterized protein LOC126816126 n=1 Tax=Patella vulgata TaxID=6465 RepID=UPI0021804065|nr:uncharacterized protein LOC126816126 [Patella vulgata]